MKQSLVGRIVICNHVIFFYQHYGFLVSWYGEAQTRYLGKSMEPLATTYGQGNNNLLVLGLARENVASKRNMVYGLVDTKEAKYNLLCKWIVKAMELGKST